MTGNFWCIATPYYHNPTQEKFSNLFGDLPFLILCQRVAIRYSSMSVVKYQVLYIIVVQYIIPLRGETFPQGDTKGQRK